MLKMASCHTRAPPHDQAGFGITEEQNVQLLSLTKGDELQYSAPPPKMLKAEKPMRPQNESGGDSHVCPIIESECNTEPQN
jgi:hypothetical protein